MTVYYDAQGKPVELGASVGRGGEAVVYRVSGQPTRLAKIYEPAPRANYQRKLTWMVEHPPLNPTRGIDHSSIAWPDGVLFDRSGQLKGYRMPFIRRTVPLLDVFNPRRRAVLLPQFDRHYLHRVARNLAAALGALHRSGYVAGDLNESNVLVTPTALVTLIDADSFQVTEKHGDQEVIHPCPVGKFEYTPPELQGKRLSEVVRLPEHDAFGLAVLIFQILMQGNHPFRAQWLRPGDPPPLEQRIAMGAFPYTVTLNSPVLPPKGAPDFNLLNPWLCELFRRSFIDGHRDPKLRPTPDDWERAIAEAERDLVTCQSGHVYSAHVGHCPYCPPEKRQPFKPGFQQQRQQRPQPSSAASTAPAAQPAQSPHRGGFTPNRPQPASTGTTTGTSSPRPGMPGMGSGFGTRFRSSGGSAWRFSAPGPANFWGRLGYSAPGTPAAKPAPAASTVPASASSPAAAAAASPPGGLGLRNRVAAVQALGLRNWIKLQAYRGFFLGGGNGAVAGSLPGMIIGLMAGTNGEALNWSLLFALGGAAGGLFRGWNPGYRLGLRLNGSVGWLNFWQIAGTVFGAITGGVMGLLFGWAILPIFLGPVVGARTGRKVGRRIWLMGSSLGWERIWGAVAALSAAGLGWIIAGLAGSLGMSSLGSYFTVALDYGGVRPLLNTILSGAFTSALGGWVAGMFAEFIAGLLGLAD